MSVVRIFTYSRLLERKGRLLLQRAPKRFASWKPVAHIDRDNIINSPIEDIEGFKGLYLHDYLFENLEKWHDKTAVECAATGKSYTYGQLYKLSGKLATSLKKFKLQPDDTIALVLPNVPEYIIVMLGASMAGIRTCLINPVYTPAEIQKQLESSKSRAVFTSPAKHNDIAVSIQNNSRIKLPIIIVNDQTGSAPSGTLRFEDLVRDDLEEYRGEVGIDTEGDFILPYSSGTTGLPKGVQLSHRSVIANLVQVSHNRLFPGMETTRDHQDVIPVILPMYHIYGLAVVMLKYLRHGSKLVCMPQFTLPRFIELLEKHRPHMMYLVPPMIQMMGINDTVQPRHFDRTRLIISGAAPLGKESIAIFRDRIKSSVHICQGYGMTEASPVLSLSKDGPSESNGYIISNTQLRIVRNHDDGTTTNLGFNETGEIYARGPQIMKGYYNNPQATTETMDGDWLKTGDLGYCTNEGLLYIKGRLKELIKVKGYQVPPAELEEVIRSLDKIQDVAVIGVPHEKFGEIPKAFIVPKPGVKIDEEEIKTYVAERVAKFKHLGYVQFLENIPKSAAGKILRKQLQNM